MKGGNDMYQIWERLSYQSIINIATWVANYNQLNQLQ
jgi:hypothetical protein